MIIPDNLSPFPVMPPADKSDQAEQVAGDEFVSESTIRKLLIGPMMVTPLVTTRVSEDQGFAGRDDIDEDVALPFITRSSAEAHEEVAVTKFEPEGPHPAMAEPRHAAPPRPRIQKVSRTDSRQGSDRWWVLGMGVALLAIIASGALIELVSNEALRRADDSPTTENIEATPAGLHGNPQDSVDPSIAVSNPEYPAP